jgi:Zn finger protein HypA/HybF involved in hydrogenase expression
MYGCSYRHEWPKIFYVLCWKCRGRVYLQMDRSLALTEEDTKCPACGAQFVLKTGDEARIKKTP